MSNMVEFLSMSRALIEKESRAERRYAYIGQGRGLASILGGRLRICVASDDLSLTPCFVMDGFWESWITKAVGELPLQGKLVIDIGANVGYYSLLALSLGASEVISYEPQPRLADCITRSAIMNGYFDKFEVRCMAVGAADGKGKIGIPLCGGSDLLLGSGHMVHPDGPGIPCKVERLRVEELAAAALVKIDAEGFEQQIWRGGSWNVMRPGAVVLLEYTPGSYEGDFLKEIAEYGFSFNTVQTDGRIGPFDPNKPINGFEMLWLVKK